jgi:hypothetical protein
MRFDNHMSRIKYQTQIRYLQLSSYFKASLRASNSPHLIPNNLSLISHLDSRIGRSSSWKDVFKAVGQDHNVYSELFTKPWIPSPSPPSYLFTGANIVDLWRERSTKILLFIYLGAISSALHMTASSKHLQTLEQFI